MPSLLLSGFIPLLFLCLFGWFQFLSLSFFFLICYLVSKVTWKTPKKKETSRSMAPVFFCSLFLFFCFFFFFFSSETLLLLLLSDQGEAGNQGFIYSRSPSRSPVLGHSQQFDEFDTSDEIDTLRREVQVTWYSNFGKPKQKINSFCSTSKGPQNYSGGDFWRPHPTWPSHC